LDGIFSRLSKKFAATLSGTTSGMLSDAIEKRYRWRISDVRYRRRATSWFTRRPWCFQMQRPPPAVLLPSCSHTSPAASCAVPCHPRRLRHSPAPPPRRLRHSPAPSRAARAAAPRHPHAACVAALRRAAGPGAVSRRLVKMLPQKERE
jgi:hypothetical protein